MDFIYALAPMEKFTNDSFRFLAHKHGADLTFTEMVMFDALAKNNKTSLERIKITNNVPTEIQIAGLNENHLRKFLENFTPEPGFSGFCLNIGCPSPKLINHGMGCAMIRRVSKVERLVRIIKAKGFRASVKLRLGANRYEFEKRVYINLIKGVSADYFIVHARHGKQSLDEPSNWSAFKKCCKTGKTIIANGDIKTLHNVELLREFGVSGVMIGRAAIRNPAIFDKLKGATKIPKLKSEYLEISKDDKNKIYRKNVLKFLKK